MAQEPLNNDAPITYLVKTVKGVRRTLIYYDPDVFDETIILSASLVIGQDDPPFDEHYNTVHDEDLGTSGTAWQPLEDIAIAIYPVPKRTTIEGPIRMKENTTKTYNLPNTYDTGGNFTYQWFIDSGAANIGSQSGKTADVNFTGTGTVKLRVRISNAAGCYRDITKFLFPGILPRRMLVVRNSYY
jgi:hypothetical protein